MSEQRTSVASIISQPYKSQLVMAIWLKVDCCLWSKKESLWIRPRCSSRTMSIIWSSHIEEGFSRPNKQTDSSQMMKRWPSSNFAKSWVPWGRVSLTKSSCICSITTCMPRKMETLPTTTRTPAAQLKRIGYRKLPGGKWQVILEDSRIRQVEEKDLLDENKCCYAKHGFQAKTLD